MSFLIDGLAGHMNRQLLRYAVGRAIMCPSCSTILDESDSVLVTLEDRSAIQCGTCFDECVRKLDARGVGIPDEDINDGRIGR